MSKAHALDIFETLRAIDRHDVGFLDRLDEKARKGFVPTVVLRWTSAVRGQHAPEYLWLTNEIANKDFHSLYEYPDLQYRLLASIGLGKVEGHVWIPLPKAGKSPQKIHNFLARFYPLASAKEIDLLLSKYSRDEFVEFVYSTGSSPQETKELIDAYEAKDGKPKKGKGKS